MKDMRTGVGFSSATDGNETLSQVDEINQKIKRESFSDEEVDIVSTGKNCAVSDSISKQIFDLSPLL